jgi:ATP synthase protein I
MTPQQHDVKLQTEVERRVDRERRARAERPTLLAQTVFLGTLGLLMVLPVVFFAYIGIWLDQHLSGFAVRWTVSMILIGIGAGAGSAYLYIREHP